MFSLRSARICYRIVILLFLFKTTFCQPSWQPYVQQGPVGQSFTSACFVNQSLYFVGGLVHPYGSSSSDTWELTTDKLWAKISGAQSDTPIAGHTLTYVVDSSEICNHGCFLLAGGASFSSTLNSNASFSAPMLQVLNLANFTWSTISGNSSSYPIQRILHASASVKLSSSSNATSSLLAGGLSSTFETLDDVWVTSYNPSSGIHETSNLTSLPTPSYGHSLVTLANGTVLLLGGFTQWPNASSLEAAVLTMNSSQVADLLSSAVFMLHTVTASSTWSHLTSLPSGGRALANSWRQGDLLVLYGGVSASATLVADVLNLTTSTWLSASEVASMFNASHLQPPSTAAAASVTIGTKVYLVGGFLLPSTPVKGSNVYVSDESSVYAWDTGTNAWSLVVQGGIPARQGAQMAVQGDSVVLLGGHFVQSSPGAPLSNLTLPGELVSLLPSPSTVSSSYFYRDLWLVTSSSTPSASRIMSQSSPSPMNLSQPILLIWDESVVSVNSTHSLYLRAYELVNSALGYEIWWFHLVNSSYVAWTNVHTSVISQPSPSCYPRFLYSATFLQSSIAGGAGYLVLQSGWVPQSLFSSSPVLTASTCLLDLSDNTWFITPSGQNSYFQARYATACVGLPESASLICYGGSSASLSPLGDIWRSDPLQASNFNLVTGGVSLTWRQVSLPSFTPGLRTGHSLAGAINSNTGQALVLMYGGRTSPTADDVWLILPDCANSTVTNPESAVSPVMSVGSLPSQLLDNFSPSAWVLISTDMAVLVGSAGDNTSPATALLFLNLSDCTSASFSCPQTPWQMGPLSSNNNGLCLGNMTGYGQIVIDPGNIGLYDVSYLYPSLTFMLTDTSQASLVASILAIELDDNYFIYGIQVALPLNVSLSTSAIAYYGPCLSLNSTTLQIITVGDVTASDVGNMAMQSGTVTVVVTSPSNSFQGLVVQLRPTCGGQVSSCSGSFTAGCVTRTQTQTNGRVLGSFSSPSTLSLPFGAFPVPTSSQSTVGYEVSGRLGNGPTFFTSVSSSLGTTPLPLAYSPPPPPAITQPTLQVIVSVSSPSSTAASSTNKWLLTVQSISSSSTLSLVCQGYGTYSSSTSVVTCPGLAAGNYEVSIVDYLVNTISLYTGTVSVSAYTRLPVTLSLSDFQSYVFFTGVALHPGISGYDLPAQGITMSFYMLVGSKTVAWASVASDVEGSFAVNLIPGCQYNITATVQSSANAVATVVASNVTISMPSNPGSLTTPPFTFTIYSLALCDPSITYNVLNPAADSWPSAWAEEIGVLDMPGHSCTFTLAPTAPQTQLILNISNMREDDSISVITNTGYSLTLFGGNPSGGPTNFQISATNITIIYRANTYFGPGFSLTWSFSGSSPWSLPAMGLVTLVLCSGALGLMVLVVAIWYWWWRRSRRQSTLARTIILSFGETTAGGDGTAAPPQPINHHVPRVLVKMLPTYSYGIDYFPRSMLETSKLSAASSPVMPYDGASTSSGSDPSPSKSGPQDAGASSSEGDASGVGDGSQHPGSLPGLVPPLGAPSGPDEGGTPDCCSICLLDFQTGDKVKTLPCSHIFHPSCIDVWLARDVTCPLCKGNVITAMTVQRPELTLLALPSPRDPPPPTHTPAPLQPWATPSIRGETRPYGAETWVQGAEAPGPSSNPQSHVVIPIEAEEDVEFTGDQLGVSYPPPCVHEPFPLPPPPGQGTSRGSASLRRSAVELSVLSSSSSRPPSPAAVAATSSDLASLSPASSSAVPAVSVSSGRSSLSAPRSLLSAPVLEDAPSPTVTSRSRLSARTRR